MRNTNIGDVGGIGIGEVLDNLNDLTNLELNLSNNLIEDAGVIEIEENMSNLDKLTNLVLDFGNNSIIGEWIGNELTSLNNLVDLSLYLNDNSVDNNAFDSIL